MDTIDKLQIEIEASSKSASNSLEGLKKTLKTLKDLSSQINSISGVQNLTDIANGIKTIADAGSSPGLAEAIKQLRKLAKLDFAQMSKSSNQLQKIAANAQGTNVTKLPDVDTSPFAKIKAAVSGVLSNFKSVKDVGTFAFNSIGTAVKFAGSKLLWFYTTLGKGVLSGLKTVGGYIKNQFVGAFTNAAKAGSRFLSSIGRIAMYRMIRSALKAITQGISEGIQNLYQYSNLLGGQFAASLDSASSSFLYLKNSIGAAAAPLINALVPAIQAVINQVVEAINVINQLIALLSGASSWAKAIPVEKKFADATSKAGGAAGKAAKEIRNLTAGYDELNILNVDQGSGGGGASATDYSGMFEEMSFGDGFIGQMKSAIENGDWASVGQILGDKINSIFDSINFESAGQRVAEKIDNVFTFLYNFLDTVNFDAIGEKVATFFNQIFDPEKVDWSQIGAVFAMKWASFIDFAYGFVTSFNYENFGQAIGDFISGWWNQIDLVKIVNTIQTFFLGMLSAAQTTIRNIPWVQIGHDLASALNEINLPEIIGQLAVTGSELLTNFMESIKSFIETLDWQGLGKKLWDSLVEVVNDVDWEKLISTAFGLLGSALGAVSGLILGFAQQAWEAIKQGFEETKSYFNEYIEAAGGDIIQGLFNGITNALTNVGSWVKENIFTPFTTAFENAFRIGSPSKEMEEEGTFLPAGLYEGISKEWYPITNFFIAKLAEIRGMVNSSWKQIGTITTNEWNDIGKTLETSLNNINAMMQTSFKAINDTVDTSWNAAKTTTENTMASMKDTVNSIWDQMRSHISEVIRDIVSQTNEMVASIKESISNTLDALSDLQVSINEQSFGSAEVIYPKQYASGGFVNSGDLFIANESGAEMIGSIGSKTAVANNDQIVEAIAQGVAVSNERSDNLLATACELLEVIANKDLSIDGRVLSRQLANVSRRNGYTLRTT